ncbi:MAG: acetylxylan esterase [Anaerolineae bacterium]|nr:acetylxylan esterase [Anaerolineae bacterium]
MRKGYGHMVLDYYVERLRKRHAERREKLFRLSREEALVYRDQVRQSIMQAFAPLPQKTPLNARVVGEVERPRFRIEKVLFESRPGCLVTANLYLPQKLDGPAPAVLGACGHSPDGKACDLYQAFAQRLAMAGFVVLVYDPFNQGERDQYALLTARDSVAACTSAHNMMGKQLELLGEFFGMWRAWDGIRALDYLLSRPEVDPSRVGITGNSGGGTMTTWLWALDERFTMAAPGCFITTFLHNLENELPADCEQCPPGVLKAGLEMADFLIARAPAPVILLGQHYDFFDRRGYWEACEEVRHFYRLLGAPEENVACFCGPHAHGYYRENQEAMVRFFARHAGLGEVEVGEAEPLPAELLNATPSGNVVEAGAKPIYLFISEKAEELARRRRPLPEEELRAKLSELLQLPSREGVPHHRNLRPIHTETYTFARYAVETEDGIRALLRKKMDHPEWAHSLDVEEEVHLYLPHLASEEDLANDPLALSLQEKYPLYALDVRGLGESIPDEEGPFWQPYGMDYMFHAYGLMFGESYLGRRVFDVLRTLDLLAHEGAQKFYLYGRGQGGLLALFTALLDERVQAVTLKNTPRSYKEWASVPLVDWPAANFLWGVLHHFDLEDCLRALGDRVTFIEPWGPDMQSA